MAYDFALVAQGDGKPPTAWNLYHTREDAEAAKARTAPDSITGRTYAEVMSYEEFQAVQRAYWMGDRPLAEVTADTWNEMLNVLPPMRWERKDGVERFLMCEFLTGSLTQQYARHGSRYWTMLVDVSDQTTWITADKIHAALKGA